MPLSKQRKPAPAVAVRRKYPYFNRELSWLAFNRRVLQQAQREDVPLLERLKFLAIVSSNLDEFFEIRVAGLIQQVDSDVEQLSLDGLNPREQLRRIHLVVASLVEDQYRCWHGQLVPALHREGIVFKTAAELGKRARHWVESFFDKEVFPVLTPLAVDPSHPFPQIGNKTLNVMVVLQDRNVRPHQTRLVILPVPRILPRVVQVGATRGRQQTFIFLSEIIKLCANRLFPGCRILSAKAFRITRNSDLYIDEEEADNLLKKIEEELRNLRRGAAVRLEAETGVDDPLFDTLLNYVQLPREYVFRIDGPLNLLRLMPLTEAIDRPDLKYPSFRPRLPEEFRTGKPILDLIKSGDRLLHHPYDSFDPVVRFVEEAAQDPGVLAVKQTLYRTSGDSPVIAALIEAARKGKQVTAVIELKARFDESNNIQWARRLEEAGVHVVYGIVGLKVHCKCTLVVRKEVKGIHQYAHLGTGNYNPKTARLYTDCSLFTAHPEITREVALLFNTITGMARPQQFRHLLVAPFNLHQEVQKRILTEAENARKGTPARILLQVNSLIDRTTINNLYLASQAGVQIDLLVRGICGIVPGIQGLSEHIRVRSIVGRFLEHPRIFYFRNGKGKPLFYMGSADWMPRNFFRRVEVVFPILDAGWQSWILDTYFPTVFRDTVDARELQSNGAYLRMDHSPEGPAAQQVFQGTGKNAHGPSLQT